MASRRLRLIQRRTALGLTQEQLAEHAGVDRSTAGRWERGESEPQPWQRPRLARTLQLSVQQLDDLLSPTDLDDAGNTDHRDDCGDKRPEQRQRQTLDQDLETWHRIMHPATLLPTPREGERDEGRMLLASAGRFFDGQAIEARIFPAADDGRVVTTLPAGFVESHFLRASRRGLIVGAVDVDQQVRGFGLDSRQARRRLSRSSAASRLLMPPAYILDDLTVGILWAVVNLDEPLLNDDGLLADLQRHLAQYESLPHSSVGRDLAADLTTVSQMWLGSDFCARHILRHLADLNEVPEFWTREQRGEEASTWLLFRHKYDYLQAVSDRFADADLSRGFCIPPESVRPSPRAERILLLLAIALMESFRIQVTVSADPEYAGVEGFVLDRGRRAIVANWVDADGIWQVDVESGRPRIQDYSDLTAYTGAHSTIRGRSPAKRLRSFADYLELDWPWLVHRCAQLAAYGCAGLAEPRSRLLSAAGVDRACRYVAQVGAATD